MTDEAKAHNIEIRWKPFMWWAYVNGEATSNLHGANPEDLTDHCLHVWPEATVTVDEPSRVYAALSTIQDAIAKFLHPTGGNKDQFIHEVLAAADDKEVVKAVRAAQGKADAR